MTAPLPPAERIAETIDAGDRLATAVRRYMRTQIYGSALGHLDAAFALLDALKRYEETRR